MSQDYLTPPLDDLTLSLDNLSAPQDNLTHPKDNVTPSLDNMKIPLYSIDSYFDDVKSVIVSVKFTKGDLTTAKYNLKFAIVSH